MSSSELNPQPEPPGRNHVDLGQLTETVTLAVQNALAAHKASPVIFNPRIIVGIIAEPQFFQAAERGGGPE